MASTQGGVSVSMLLASVIVQLARPEAFASETTKQKEDGTTGEFTEAQLRRRKVEFEGIIALCVAAVVLVALCSLLVQRRKQQHTYMGVPDEKVDEVFGQPSRPGGLRDEESPAQGASQEHSGNRAVALIPQTPKRAANAALVEEAEKKQQEMLQKNEDFIWKRSVSMALLFLAYVCCCIVIPWLSFETLTCRAGFFWETHMIFLGMFAITKITEVFLYVNDPTLTGTLNIFFGHRGFPFGVPDGFCWKFVMSFLGFVDGYQDSCAIAVAFACPDATAQMLARWMLAAYIMGVVVLQWGVVAILAWSDPTKACFAKLLHMDTVAARITLPEEELWTWRFLHAARTFGEDIPQAFLQTLYLLYVRHNPFMMVSVGTAVFGSLLALRDAVKRGLTAAGFTSEANEEQKSVHVGWDYAIHGIVWVSRSNQLSGILLADNGEPMRLLEDWQERCSSGPENTLMLDEGEYIVQVDGHECTWGFLCYDLTFTTNRGRSKTFKAECPSHRWQGAPFSFQASEGSSIVGLTLENGRCLGTLERPVGTG